MIAVSPASRDPWLDNVKMVLVTLVVVGHAIGLVEATAGSHWVYDFIYLWHIPAFVFVSGYLSKSFEWDRRRMKSLVYTLAIPYLLFEPALFYYRREVADEGVTGPLWFEPHWTMWYLIVLLMWRLITPILKRHWLFLPLSVIVSLAGGLWDTEALMIPRMLGLLPFFVLGLHLKPRHLAHLDDVWVRVAAVPTLVGIGIMAVYTDTWADTALLWYDTGYNEIPIDNEIVFQTRLTVMMVGLLGAFAAMSLIPRRSLGWFTTMGTATMVIYLFHGFVIKTFKAIGWPEFTDRLPGARAGAHDPRSGGPRPAARHPARTPRAGAVHQPAGLAGGAPRPPRGDPRGRPAYPGPHVGLTAERGTTSRWAASARVGACPPRCAGCHGARSPGAGTWCGSRCSSSSCSVSSAPSRRVNPTRSSPAAKVIGSPKDTSTRRPRRRLGRGFRPRASGRPTDQSRCDPQIAAGTTGAPVSLARLATPRISDRTVYDQLTPASGNASTASPSRSSRRALRYAAAGASRSTGTCCMRSIAVRTSGRFHTSCRHRKRR